MGSTGDQKDGAAAAAAVSAEPSAAQLVPATPRQHCDLEVEPSQWADSCQLFRDACIDQGSIILYGEEHRMAEGRPGTAPYQLTPAPDYARYIFQHRGSDADSKTGRDYRYGLPPIRVRPASATEGVAYLQEPAFSSCTVPIVWYPMWADNIAHFFRDNAAKLLGALRGTPWARHAKFALVTAEGHAAPAMNYDVLQPLAPQWVETWADFSARLPARRASDGSGFVPLGWAPPGAGPATPPLSWEGGPQRCFRRLFVCHRGINITSWPLHGLGQQLVAHYRGSTKLAEVEAAVAAAAPPEQAGPAGGEAEAEAPPAGGVQRNTASSGAVLPTNSSAGSERVLRVIFHRRRSPDRQLLNAGELVEQCNRWRHTTAGGERLRGRCWEVEPADLFSGMAAAQQADVFVGVHGANMANGWLMRPGSSMVELHPHGFTRPPAPSLQYPLFNMEDSGSQVLWWVISMCDPAASTPGQPELQGVGKEDSWPKFRNIILRWEALEHALRAVAEAGGNMTAYREDIWKQGRWLWWAGPGGRVQEAGKGRFTQMSCANATFGGGEGGGG